MLTKKQVSKVVNQMEDYYTKKMDLSAFRGAIREVLIDLPKLLPEVNLHEPLILSDDEIVQILRQKDGKVFPTEQDKQKIEGMKAYREEVWHRQVKQFNPNPIK